MSAREPSAAISPEREESEFGAGIVVCLAKFSEHLWNRHYDRIIDMARWLKMTDDERAAQEAEARRYPHGDAAATISNVRIFGRGNPVEALSGQIEMWMNGASDHFYDLDEERAGPKLKALANLALRIGHGFTGDTWTMEHVERLRDLWRQACLEVDRTLGTEPDWGQW